MPRRERSRGRTRTVYVAIRRQNRWDWAIEGTVIVASSIIATLILVSVFHV
jgi:hypothetical protein